LSDHVRLRTQDDYYSREVTVEGFVTRFRIRELDEQTLVELDRLDAQAREASLQAGLSEEESLRILPLLSGENPEEETTPEARAESRRLQRDAIAAAAELSRRLADTPAETRQQILVLQRQRRDLIVTHGLVGWDIPDTPFSPEAATGLPEWVKAELVTEILADTNMPERGLAFLARPRGQ
jgi:hypothetical protein